MRRIYAISDGTFQENKIIDETLVRLLKKDRPKILFLPMALELDSYSIESLNKFISAFKKRYETELGCETSVIFTRDNPTEEEIRKEVFSSDAVYVGPGHVPTMMSKMKEFGFDKMLKEGYDKGILMAGMSAGAMCWFEPNLGFIPTKFTPHYEENDIYPVPDGYVANDPTATLFVNEKVGQIVKLNPKSNLYRFATIDGRQKRFIISTNDGNQNPGR